MTGARPEAASELQIPDWLSSKWPGVAAVARRHYDLAIVHPAEFLGHPAKAVARVATDPRMETVWGQLSKRQGGEARCGPYMICPNRERIFAHPHWRIVDGLSRRRNERNRLQEQACMVLFSVAVGHFYRDRRLNVVPRVRTVAEVTAEAESYRRLQRRLREDADECERLGLSQFAGTVRGMADFVLEQAERRKSVIILPAGDGREVPNPWIVERKSKASNDPWLSGFVKDLTINCRALFNMDLPGTIATIASVAFDRPVKEAAVRGMAKGIAKHPAPTKRRSMP